MEPAQQNRITVALQACFYDKAQKKGLRRVPTFVNLKSNTMKNTIQR